MSKVHICITQKQLAAIKLALRSAEYARTTEKDRAYLRGILIAIAQQEAMHGNGAHTKVPSRMRSVETAR